MFQERRNFVRSPPTGVSFEFELEQFLPVAQATLAADPNLEKMRFELVPKTWVYHICIKIHKMQCDFYVTYFSIIVSSSKCSRDTFFYLSHVSILYYMYYKDWLIVMVCIKILIVICCVFNFLIIKIYRSLSRYTLVSCILWWFTLIVYSFFLRLNFN